MNETIILVIPAFALFYYIMLSSIEFGASAFALLPMLMTDQDTVKNYMNPLWETTSIFLVFALTSLLTFFPGATMVWTSGIFPILFTFLACMGVRAACILLSHYGEVRTFFVRALFTLASFASALVGMMILMYFLVGTWHLSQGLFNAIAFLTITAIIFSASAFFRAYAKNPKLTQLARFSGTFFFLAAVVFMLKVFASYPYLSWQPFTAIAMPSLLGVSIIGALWAELKKAYWAVFAFFKIAMAALFWGFFISHLPYIIYGTTTIHASLTNSASYKVLVASFGVGIIFIAPALYLLYKLFIFEKPSN